MARLSRPWPLVVSQWWRWRHPDLWRGRVFDPHNAQQVISDAVLRLRRETRDVFLLNPIEALDYALIARHQGLSIDDVQARLADALCELSRKVDLIERYYDQSRAILKIPQRHRAKSEGGALAVFWDSLGGWGIDFPKLSSWFKDRETDELRRQKLRPKYVDRELEAVRKAMTTATGFRSPYFSVDAPRGLTFTKRKMQLHISQLSTGEQVFLALAGDLARRLAGLAGERTDPLDVRAIVLIDEVELHLHPLWQRKMIPWLLETFPQCQFVLSTHSPQVLSEIESRHIRILEDRPSGTRVHDALATLGRDSNHLLVSVFGVPVRREETDDLIKQADLAMTGGKLEKAQKLIAKLKGQIEGGAPEVAVLESRLARRARSQ